MEFQKKVSLTAIGLLAFLLAAKGASADPNAAVADPCQSASISKLTSSFTVNNGSATSTEIISASSQSIHVCGFSLAVIAQSQFTTGVQFQLFFGTGTNCASGTGNATGEMALGSSPLTYSGPGTIFSVPSGNALCIFTTNAIGGIITYTKP